MSLEAPTEAEKVKVIHFVQVWLAQTATWIYNHLSLLPEEVDTHIVCQWTQNVDQFPIKNLFSLESPPAAPTLWRKISRRFGREDDASKHLGLLEQIIDKVKPDILHSHFGQCGSVNAQLARKYKLRHVVSFYGLDVGYLPRVEPRWVSRYRQMSEQVDLVLCEGPHMAQCLLALGLEAKKIRVFRLGIDLSRIPFVPRKAPKGRPVRFLIAGSFREKKGIPYAVEALGLVSRKYPGIEVTLIGDSGDSEREEREKRRILEAVERCRLGSRMRMLGFQPYDVLLEELYRHDVFLAPSVTSSDGDTEGGAPVTIIEAAASGMPVVSTQHCDIPFVLSENNKPYLVPERDPVALANAIQALMDCPDWTPIISANRELVEQELDVRKQARKLADMYSLLSSRVSARERVPG